MNKTKALSILVAFLAVTGLPLAADSLSPCYSVPGNLVQNCGFEDNSFTGWIAGGNSEFTGLVTGPFVDFPGANSGSYYAYLGPVGSDGTLSQTLLTTPGRVYTFSFYLASVGEVTSDFSASWDGINLLSLSNPNTGAAFSQFQYSVLAKGSDTFQFSFRDDDNYIALDDVVVVASAVPEPGTILLLVSGIGTAFFIRRRRA